MNISKRTLVAGAAIAAVGMAGVGGVGLASAATNSAADGSTGTSIVDKIATKFDLNKDEVKAVFDEDRAAHMAEMQQHQKERLAQAVTDGKITQEQADYITAAKAEIEALMGNASPEDESDTTREQIKTKMDALRTWADDNDINMRYVGGMMHGRHGGPGGPGGFRGGEEIRIHADDSGADDRSSDSANSN